MTGRRVASFVVLVLLVGSLVVPAAVGADGKFDARLTTGAELHDVIGSEAAGNARFQVTEDGVKFSVKARGMSGAVWGAHIHGPATRADNAGVLVSLCGAPAPAAKDCRTDREGNFTVRGTISHRLLEAWGISAEELIGHMEAGLTYVNVHTDLNPAGEVRGQIG